MLEDIIVIDNAIPLDYQNYLERNILEGELNWKYRPNLGNDTAKLDTTESNPAPGVIHVFCNERGIQTNLYYKILPMVSIACQKANYNLSGVYGGRTFIQFPSNNNNFYTKIHTDLDVDHLVLLYYVIDADGDTVIFDKTTHDTPKDKLDPLNLTVLKRITPKKGTVVIFDGSRYHATTLPMLGKRCIVNINLK